MKVKDVIVESIRENDPHGTDDVNWGEVKRAVHNAAKKIHGDVDKSKVDGIMKNLYKHKPNDTENAIQIGVDMLRSNEQVAEDDDDVDLTELGRVLMDRASKTNNDEMSNLMAVVGSELVKFGTPQGANSPEDLIKRTGASMPMIEKLITFAEKALEVYGPVRTGTNKSDDDEGDKDF